MVKPPGRPRHAVGPYALAFSAPAVPVAVPHATHCPARVEAAHSAAMTDLYDADILAWSEQQAELLRRLAAGERVNKRIDWQHLIDEVESVGINELHAVNSLLLQAIVHLLKTMAWPYSRDVPHWRAEAELFRGQAVDRFAPSMRQRIDLDKSTTAPRAPCPRRSTASLPCQCRQPARTCSTNCCGTTE